MWFYLCVPNNSLHVELEWIASCFCILCVSQDLFTDSCAFSKNYQIKKFWWCCRQKWIYYVGVEVLTEALIVIRVFWETMPHQLVCSYQCFRGECFFQLQGACNPRLFTNWHGIIPQKTWIRMPSAIISFTWMGKVCIELWFSHHIADFVVTANICSLMTVIACTWLSGTETGVFSSTLASPSQ